MSRRACGGSAHHTPHTLSGGAMSAPASARIASASVCASYSLARLRSCAATAASARQRCKVWPAAGRLSLSRPASTIAHSTSPALSDGGTSVSNLRIAATASLLEESVISDHRRIGFAAQFTLPGKRLDELRQRFVELLGSAVDQRKIRIAGRQHHRQFGAIEQRGGAVKHHDRLAMAILILEKFKRQAVFAQAGDRGAAGRDDQAVIQRRGRRIDGDVGLPT